VLERVIEIGQRFVIGLAALGFFCSQNRVIDGLLGAVAPTKVKGQQFRDFFRAAAIQLLERMFDGAVMGTAAMSLEQATIGRLLGQRMPKDISAALGRGTLGDEFELAQLGFERRGGRYPGR
jgi:hypothetical protein